MNSRKNKLKKRLEIKPKKSDGDFNKGLKVLNYCRMYIEGEDADLVLSLEKVMWIIQRLETSLAETHKTLGQLFYVA